MLCSKTSMFINNPGIRVQGGDMVRKIQALADCFEKKRVNYKSFTAPSKKLAQMAAVQWQANKKQLRDIPENLMVYDSITHITSEYQKTLYL